MAGYNILFFNFSGNSTHFFSLPFIVNITSDVLKMYPIPITNPNSKSSSYPLLISIYYAEFELS